MEINQTITDYLRSNTTDLWAASAVMTERGSTYVQFNATRIGNVSDATGGVILEFLWQNVAVAWVRFPAAALTDSSRRHILPDKVEGRLKI
jgi:hypothetical protein